LRSPISFMQTVAELALGNPGADRESREAFEDILAEATGASKLLEDMLTLARADSGRGDLQFELLNLSELVEDVRLRAAPLAEAKGQALTIDAGGAITVSGDRPSVRRLIWTLVDNAIKYTPAAGRIELFVAAAGSDARLEVRDNGIGIAREMLPRVFERFFRADPSRSQVDGVGLGLAIAKWIADAHRATIAVESAEGRGTTFTVSFPLCAPAEASRRRPFL